MQIRTKLNRWVKFPFIALLTSISGGIRIVLSSFKQERLAKPISWTFNVNELVTKIKTDKNTQGLFHFLLGKLDLLTEEVVSDTAKAVIDHPVDLVPFALCMLSCTDDYVKDGYEVATLRRIEAYSYLKETPSPEEALKRLAYLGVSGAKCREPISINDFHHWMGQGFSILSFFPKPEAIPALYVLASIAKDKSVWKRQMYWAWRLAKDQYNAFYTGLLLDAYPELLKEDYYRDYMMKCVEYLREVEIEKLPESEALDYLSKVTMAMTILKKIQEEAKCE